MAVPPPPAPPAPPPQPALGKLGGGGGGSGDARSALLQSIQKGAKLKKTVTVDKSGPALAGKLVGDTSSPSRTHTQRPNGGGGTSRAPPDGPKLAGIFEGLSSMPKLKPVGSRGGATNQVSPVSPARDQVDAEVSRNDRVNDNVALDLNTELTMHLTLKKQKQAQQKNVTEANLKINRGPPPNPPQKHSTITPPDNEPSRGFQSHSPEAKRFQNMSSGVSTADGSSAGPQSGVVANKSSLFHNMASQPAPPQVKPNHGKPNLAPKPPGQLPGNGSAKASVARHHSMKSPRSPPVTPSHLGGPVFPSSANHFGTMRGTQQLFQSQESIHVNGRPSGRPTVAPPPRPPASRPPPPPIRSVSNTNLSNLPPGSLSMPTVDTSSSSLNNVSVLKEQLRNQIPVAPGSPSSTSSAVSVMRPENKVLAVNGGSVAPPLPPHRTCPAPPPPVTRQVNNASNVPPVPPQRHSSIRNSSNMSGAYPGESVGGGGHQMAIESNGRLVIDLEARFATRFHSVTEFSKPPPFTNMPKVYPSAQISRTSNG